MILNTFVTTPRLLTDILNNEKFQKMMVAIRERYIDERNRECLMHYSIPMEEILIEIIKNGHTKSNLKAVAFNMTEEPFGFHYESYYVDTKDGILKVGTIEVQFTINDDNEISYELKNFNKY